jgi:hypothetical protein
VSLQYLFSIKNGTIPSGVADSPYAGGEESVC